MKQYFLHILISLSQCLSALLGGWPDETASSYAYRMWKKGKPFGFLKVLIDKLFFFDPDHCLKSYQSELLRKQLPPALRDPV